LDCGREIPSSSEQFSNFSNLEGFSFERSGWKHLFDIVTALEGKSFQVRKIGESHFAKLDKLVHRIFMLAEL
jgi:hypothetical protein